MNKEDVFAMCQVAAKKEGVNFCSLTQTKTGYSADFSVSINSCGTFEVYPFSVNIKPESKIYDLVQVGSFNAIIKKNMR